MAEREFDYLWCFTIRRWNIILWQESLNQECLLISEALLGNEPSRSSQRHLTDLTLRGLNQDLLWEENYDLRIVSQVDGVLRDDLKGNFRSFLNYLDPCVCFCLNCASLRREGDTFINHGDGVVV